MQVTPSAPLGVSTRTQKSKLGCKTCKIRRVKCGEEKPACIRCSSTGRKCEYEGQLSISINDGLLSSSPDTVWRERRAFAYYFQQAAPSVDGGLDEEFWRTIVPQMCRSEPAVWDAIITISALFESPEPCPDLNFSRASSTLNQNHQDALGWYSRAVSAVRQGIDQGRTDIFVGLISCLLFICIEALQGSTNIALQLYQQGVHLIRELRTQVAHRAVSALQASWLEDTIVPIFDRLGTVALSVSGIPVSALLRDAGRASMQEFPSLKFARESLVLLAGETRIFQINHEEHLAKPHVKSVPTLAELKHQQATLLASLKNWHIAFSRLMHHLGTTRLSPQQIGTAAVLSACHEMHVIILETGLSTLQTATDAYLPNFQNIVSQAHLALDISARPDGTQPPFSFDIGIGLPLWFTCLRCRDPITRRAATALIRRAPQVQGFHKSDSMANLGEKIIAFEENKAAPLIAGQGAGDPSYPSIEPRPESNEPTAELIPEEARIGPIGVFRAEDGAPPGLSEQEKSDWDRSCGNQAILRFSRNERDRDTGDWRVVHEFVSVDV